MQCNMTLSLSWTTTPLPPPYQSPTVSLPPIHPVHHQYITKRTVYLICLRQFHCFFLTGFRVKSSFSDLTFGALNILALIYVSSFIFLPLHETYIPVITNHTYAFLWIYQDLPHLFPVSSDWNTLHSASTFILPLFTQYQALFSFPKHFQMPLSVLPHSLSLAPTVYYAHYSTYHTL